MHIIIMPMGKGQYSSYLEDGGLLVHSTTTPFFASARALQERGIPNDTEITMSHISSNIVSMRSTVGEAAKLTAEETSRDGIQIRKFRPMVKPKTQQGEELRFSQSDTACLQAEVG